MTDDWTTRGRKLRAEAQEARHAIDETGTSPVSRQTIREMMEAEWPPILDDSLITPSEQPEIAEREMARSPCSLDL